MEETNTIGEEIRETRARRGRKAGSGSRTPKKPTSISIDIECANYAKDNHISITKLVNGTLRYMMAQKEVSTEIKEELENNKDLL